MRNEKIIQAIAAYLGKVMTYNNSLTKIQFERTCVNGAAEFIQQEAKQIAAAIAPLVEEKDLPYTELFDHMANEHGLTLTNTELGDIIHVARGEGTKTGWEDAPDWAEWRTVDKNGQVTFWEKQPHAHLLSKYWVDDAGGNRKYCEVDNWQYKIQKRPR